MNTVAEKYNNIVEKFISEMEKGVAPWTKGWNGASFPINHTTGKMYRGINVLFLTMEKYLNNFTSNEWLTMNQAKKAGFTVKKGSASTPIFFYNLIEKTVKETDDDGVATEKTVKMPIMKYFSVFNVDQLENYESSTPLYDEVFNIDEVDIFIDSTGASISHFGSEAYYSPSKDSITMPEMSDFHSTERYYSTLLHELTHWSGHQSRLDRDLSGSFGSDSYAFEELTAELGAAFISTHFNLNIEENRHPAYLESWVKALKANPRILWKASAKAQEVLDYFFDSQKELLVA